MIGKQFAHLNSPHRENTLSYNIPIWFVLLIQQTKRSESMPRPDPLASDADALIDAVIDREGRYVNHPADRGGPTCWGITRSEEHTSELKSLMRISYAVFCLKKKNKTKTKNMSNYTYKYKNSQPTTTNIRTVRTKNHQHASL